MNRKYRSDSEAARPLELGADFAVFLCGGIRPARARLVNPRNGLDAGVRHSEKGIDLHAGESLGAKIGGSPVGRLHLRRFDSLQIRLLYDGPDDPCAHHHRS
jgi:hypothetical protein